MKPVVAQMMKVVVLVKSLVIVVLPVVVASVDLVSAVAVEFLMAFLMPGPAIDPVRAPLGVVVGVLASTASSPPSEWGLPHGGEQSSHLDPARKDPSRQFPVARAP